MLNKTLLLLLLFLGGLSTAVATEIDILQENLEIAEYDMTITHRGLSELIADILENLKDEDGETLASFKALLVRAFYLRATRYPSEEVFVDVLEAVNIEQELRETRLSINGGQRTLTNVEMSAVYLAQARYNRSDNEPKAALTALNEGLRLVPNDPAILQERAFLYRELDEVALSEKDKNMLLNLARSRRALANDRAYIFVLLAELAETPEERLLYTQQARISVEAAGVFKFDMASVEPRLARLEAEFVQKVAVTAKLEPVAEPAIEEELAIEPTVKSEPVAEPAIEEELAIEPTVKSEPVAEPAIEEELAIKEVTPSADLEQGIKAQELIDIMQRGMPEKLETP